MPLSTNNLMLFAPRLILVQGLSAANLHHSTKALLNATPVVMMLTFGLQLSLVTVVAAEVLHFLHAPAVMERAAMMEHPLAWMTVSVLKHIWEALAKNGATLLARMSQ